MRICVSSCALSIQRIERPVTLNRDATPAIEGALPFITHAVQQQMDEHEDRKTDRRGDRETSISWSGRCVMRAVRGCACLWSWHGHAVPGLTAHTGELSFQWHTFIHSTCGQLAGELCQTSTQRLTETLPSLDTNKINAVFLQCIKIWCFFQLVCDQFVLRIYFPWM